MGSHFKSGTSSQLLLQLRPEEAVGLLRGKLRHVLEECEELLSPLVDDLGCFLPFRLLWLTLRFDCRAVRRVLYTGSDRVKNGADLLCVSLHIGAAL